MIILATAIILSLNSSGIIGKANKAKLDTDKANMLEAANVALAEYQLEKQMGELNPANQTAEAYVKDKLGEQFTADTLESLSILDDGTIQVLPTIPEGFVMSPYEGEQKISEGLVIYEATAADLEGKTNLEAMETYNQYVWVPVPDMNEFKLINWNNESNFETKYVEPLRADINNMDDISNYADEIDQYNAMKASVEANGGFYIARYEAGKETINSVETAVSKKEANIWHSIVWDSTWYDVGYGIDNAASGTGAAKISKSLASSDADVVSHLIYGVQWDATLTFIEDAEHSVTDSSTWGNYSDYNSSVDSLKQIEGAGEEVKTAGYSDYWKAKNIYDMAGNVTEWTYEAYTIDDGRGHRVLRGGFYCSYYSASKREGLMDQWCVGDAYGFRVALYIK